MHGVVQEAFLRGLELGHVGERADQPNHFAVGADHRPRLERQPDVMAVGRAQPKILDQPAATLLQNAVECGAEAVAVLRMQDVEPARRRRLQRAALDAQKMLGLGAGEDLVDGDVPVPDHVAGAGERERAAFDVGHDRRGGAARECVLHHREPDQHDDQHEAAEQGRAGDVVGDEARDGKAGGKDPHDEQDPGGDQQHGAVVAVRRQVDDQGEARDRHERERAARDSRREGGIEQGERHQRAEEQEPRCRDVHIAHVPAIEVQVGEQEHQERGGQDGFAGCAPDPLGAGRDVEDLAPESEVDADIAEHRPAERGGGGKHDAALDHEQDGEEQRQQAGDADDDAMIERDAVDLVLVGVGLPQIDLRQLVGAQLRHIGHDGAGIERDAEDVGGRAFLTIGAFAARRDRHHAREPQVGPKQAGADQAVVRNDDQPVDLLVA